MKFRELFEKKVHPEHDAVSPGVQHLDTDQWMGTYKFSKDVAGHDGKKQHAPDAPSGNDVYTDKPVVVGFSDADDKMTKAAMKGKVAQTIDSGSEEPETVHKKSPLSKNEDVEEAYQHDESNVMYRYDADRGRLVQAMISNHQEQTARQRGYKDTPEQALKAAGVMRSKFDTKKFVQNQNGKWVEVFPYGQQGTAEGQTADMRAYFAQQDAQNPIKPTRGPTFQSKEAYLRWLAALDKEKKLKKEELDEKWSEKYKRSIDCSHPKGFSQRAHCQGKKKHNESIEMEMVCPDCGMCETHGSLEELKKGQKDANGYTKCWPGYHADGTKKGKNGGQVRNCVPNEDVEQTDEGVIYQLSKDAPMDDTEVLVLGGAGRYSFAGLREKARREAAQLAKDLEVEHGGAFRRSAHNVKQLMNTLNTIVAAYDELNDIRKRGGVKSKGIRDEDIDLFAECLNIAAPVLLESREGSLLPDIARALPAAYVFPQLINSDTYKQYRFGVALAQARGEAAPEGFKPPVMSAESAWGENQVVVSRDPDIEKYLRRAMQIMNISAMKLISTKESQEATDVDVTSPVPEQKGQ